MMRSIRVRHKIPEDIPQHIGRAPEGPSCSTRQCHYLGLPMSTPNTGMNNVRKVTGIKCFRHGSKNSHFLAPYLTKKADASGVPITVNNADHPADITFLPPMGIPVTTDINRPTKAPVAIPMGNNPIDRNILFRRVMLQQGQRSI